MLSHPDTLEIMDLIDRANRSGLKLLLVEDSLELRLVKGKRPEPELLADIRDNKERIECYLGTFKVRPKDVEMVPQPGFCAEGFAHEGELYYDITPTQMYWADEEKDKAYKESESSHGVMVLRYRIVGDFDRGLFQEAVNYVVGRHESLRAVFRRVEGRYRMRVVAAERDRFHVEYVDISNDPLAFDRETKQEGRRISVSEGPLVLFRLIRTGDRELVLSIKLHHIISDTWSIEVLLNDLLTVYGLFLRGGVAELSELPFQLKEYLAFFNAYRTTYGESHKAHWRRLYSRVPPELRMPWAKRNGNCRFAAKTERVYPTVIPATLRNFLGVLSGEHRVSLFVMLQATVKAFLYAKTGEPDLLIGTEVSGRDHPALYGQIGSYARTDLIRTVFGPADTFRDAITRVAESNRDLAMYRAFTLTAAIDALLAPGQHYDSFWKVKLLFNDATIHHAEKENGRMVEELAFQAIPIIEKEAGVIPIDMILNFYNHKEELLLHVHYDNSLYEEEAICGFIREYLAFCEKMAIDNNQRIID
jgi:hypothetical protein